MAEISTSTTTATMPRDQLVATLEAEVQNLTNKASEAADRLADYEEEIRNLKTNNNNNVQPHRIDSPLETTHPAPAPLSRQSSTTSGRFTFLTRNISSSAVPQQQKPTPAPSSTTQTPSSQTSLAITELQAALAKETQLRLQAERKVADVEAELEDLSATLFEQANEMVRTERVERHRLEERIKVLERKDGDKDGRMERIERAVERLERVRLLLDQR